MNFFLSSGRLFRLTCAVKARVNVSILESFRGNLRSEEPDTQAGYFVTLSLASWIDRKEMGASLSRCMIFDRISFNMDV